MQSSILPKGQTMSDAPFDRHPVAGGTSIGEAVVYRGLFAVLFIFSAVALMLGRLVGQSSTTSIFTQAKQAAHATAGYAVKY